MLVQERGNQIQNALYRAVTFFDVVGYAPLWMECVAWMEWGTEDGEAPSAGEFAAARDALIANGTLETQGGRVARRGSMEGFMQRLRDADVTFPRKLRCACRVARHLARIAGVRFVALVNTTALGAARNNSDLDFFVIVRDGGIWSTRLLSATPYRILGRLASATADNAAPDAVCLSYFISDAGLDLSSHMLSPASAVATAMPPDDPYFHYWFLSMLPLFDDGVSRELWEQNGAIRERHRLARPWIPSPDIAVRAPRFRLALPRFLEPLARRIQMRWFPSRIRDRMNTDTTVIVNDRVLKFHVDDAREKYREAYREHLRD
jgi:hypothetical protein